FTELATRFYETGESFEATDYCARTPDWALYGSELAGFNPSEQRWKRKQKPANAEREKRIKAEAKENSDRDLEQWQAAQSNPSAVYEAAKRELQQRPEQLRVQALRRAGKTIELEW
ncbi:MAG: hypothetical protein MHM6MM_007080, partial [Cercozoa sp. M6MM]